MRSVIQRITCLTGFLLVQATGASGALLDFGWQAPQIAGAADSTASSDTIARIPGVLDGEAYASVNGLRARVYFASSDALVAERVRQLLDDQAPLPGLPALVPSGVHAVLAHSSAAFDEVTGG
ncbi:MAG: hypothetical protein ACKVIN_01445, partial [Longimicrobiales bacterium]